MRMTSMLMCTSQEQSILEDSTNGNGNGDDGGGGDAIDNDGGGNDVDEYSWLWFSSVQANAE